MARTHIPENTVVLVPKDEGGGSFLTGFVVGVLAGAAGIFFLGTERGKEAVSGLHREWDDVKHKLEKELGTEFEPKSIGQSMRDVLSQVGEYLEKEESKKTPPRQTKPQQKKRFFFH